MAERLPRLTLWLVGLAIVAMLSYAVLHLPIPYGDQFDEIYYTLTQSPEEVFSWYFSPSRHLFRPLEVVIRFLVVELFGPYLNSYGFFQIALVSLVAPLALGLTPARSWSEAGAAITALTFLFGHHAFLAVMEANITISNGVVLLLMLLVLWILQSKGGLFWQLLAIAISAVAVLTKEVGLTVPFALVLGAFLGFPGVRRWTAALLIALVGAYLAFRAIGLPGALEGVRAPGKAGAALGYLSNVLATPILIITGEPFDGVWSEFLRRDFNPWRVVRIAAGLATVGVIAAGYALRHAAARTFPENELVDRRWLLLLAGVLAVCAGLGFQYTRHRFGAMVLPIAFLLFYRSLRIIIWRLSLADLRAWLRLGAFALILSLSLAWSSRAADSFIVLRYIGAKTMIDWIEHHAKFRENERTDPRSQIYLDGFFWAAQDLPWPTIQRDPKVLETWLGREDVLNR